MTDPFIIRLPRTLAEDRELAPYFNFLGKVLHDLTRVRAAITDAGDVTVYTPHDSGAVAVVSAAATDLDTLAASVKTLQGELTDTQTQLNLLLQTLRDHGIVAA